MRTGLELLYDVGSYVLYKIVITVKCRVFHVFLPHVNTFGWTNAKIPDKRQKCALVREGASRRQWLLYMTHYLVSSGHEPRVGGEY
jgi:hypothetical protein